MSSQPPPQDPEPTPATLPDVDADLFKPENAWKQRPGKPSIRVITQNGVIITQFMATGLTVAMPMRPEVAVWLGQQLVQQGNLAKSGLIIAGPNGPPLKGVPD